MITTSELGFSNIVDYLFENSLSIDWRDRPYLVTPEQSYSFADLHEKVCQVGHLLRRAGVAPGDRVLFSVRDGIEFPAIFLGAMMIGAVSIPINTYLKPRDYEYYIRESGAKVVIVDHLLATLPQEIMCGASSPIQFYTIGGELENDLGRAMRDLPKQIATEPRAPDDMAFWLYSSGTTGDPKGVVHTHAHLYWATQLFGLGTMGVDEKDVILCPPKMFFAFGLGNQVYFPVRAGARVIADSEPPRPEAVLSKLLEHEPTIFVAVPTLYASILRLMEDYDSDRIRHACRHLRLCISGGEVLPPALARAWLAKTGTEILDGVGTTEMTHMFLLNRPGQSVPNSCGRLVDGYRARIVDDSWSDVPCGEIGNLFVIGPTAAREYWNKPEKTRAMMRDGGVLTGDKFYRDADGNYFYVGRNDDMLRVGGIWVSPAEIETTLAEHAAVGECAVVGAPDDSGMIKPKAYVVARDPASVSDALADDIRNFLRETLAHYKCPRWIEFVPDLPKTATGKIQRFRLAERARREWMKAN